MILTVTRYFSLTPTESHEKRTPLPKRIKVSICVMLAFAVAGCVPFLTFIDFTPQMAGGEIRTSNCIGKESVEYKVEGIQLASSLSMRSTFGGKAPLLYVFFTIPKETKVELLLPEISVIPLPSTTIKRVPIPGFKTPRTQAQISSRLPPPESNEVNFRNLTATSSYAIEVPLTGMLPGDFRVELPDMKINDRVVKIPPIDFKKFRRTEVMAPLNC
jgi:hypothetical protein